MIGIFRAETCYKGQENFIYFNILVILTEQKENQVIITSGSETLPELRVGVNISVPK